MNNSNQGVIEQRIVPIKLGEPDDLFIACVSFEPRSTYVASRLNSKLYKTNSVILIRYHGNGIEKDESERQLCAFLRPVNLSGEIEAVYFDKFEVDSFYQYIRKICNKRPPIQKITVDITTLTKRYLLILLHCLRSMLPQSTIRLLYTPGVYASNEILSWGIKEISALPYLGGLGAADSNKRALVLLLGYEGERAYGIMKYVEPELIFAVIGNPPTHPGDNLPSRRDNRLILEDPRSVTAEVPALVPDDTCELLSKWYQNPKYKDFMWYISPLGTKMQTVGIYLFFERFKNESRAQVIYASPLKYNKKKYTINYDRQCICYAMPPL